jgi:hypothetical protein
MSTAFLHKIMTGCLLLLMCVILSCRKEASLVPDQIPDFYTLPQGNQPYDDSIVAFHQKYGSYILYKFTPTDLTYNYSSTLPVTSGPANPAWIKYTLDYFKSECLNYYPESFLQKVMPFKILLAAYIDTSWRIGLEVTPIGRAETGFCATQGTLAIGWADSTLAQQSPARLKALRGFMHRSFIEQALLSGGLEVPADFRKNTPDSYTSAYPGVDGILESLATLRITNATVIWDFTSYVCAITGHTKAELDATILSPSFDRRGLVQLKYNAVINFFKNNYNIDLQAIGNHP